MQNKKLLIIGASWEQRELIKEAKSLGHYVIATHPKRTIEGMSLADVFFEKDSRDITAHLEIAKTYDVDGVLTDNCDYSFHTASIIAQALNLPFASIQSAIYSNNKYAQRLACEKAQIRQPEFYLVETLKEIERAAKKMEYPIIVKPVDSRGTFGVTVVEEVTKLKDAFLEAIMESPSRRVICEKFIQGILVTVDGFCFKNEHHSLTVASSVSEDGVKPVTKEIVYPAQFKESTKIALLKKHHEVVKALNYQYGHTHGEYLLGKNQVIYLVECANRGGGVCISSSVVPELTQINVNRLLVNQSLGQDNFNKTIDKIGLMHKAAILTFLDFEVGKVIKKINLEELQSLPYVLKFRSLFREKDIVKSVINCASRHSMLIVIGKNVSEIYSNLEDFKSKMNIEYY